MTNTNTPNFNDDSDLKSSDADRLLLSKEDFECPASEIPDDEDHDTDENLPDNTPNDISWPPKLPLNKKQSSHTTSPTALGLFRIENEDHLEDLCDFAKNHRVLDIKVVSTGKALVLYERPCSLKVRTFQQAFREQSSALEDKVNDFCSKHDVVSIKTLYDAGRLVDTVVYRQFKKD